MSKSNLHIISPFTYYVAAPCILTMKFSMHSPIEKVKHSWDNRPVLQNSRCLAILKHWFVVPSLYTKGAIKTLSDWLTDMVRSPPPTVSSETWFPVQSLFLKLRITRFLKLDFSIQLTNWDDQ